MRFGGVGLYWVWLGGVWWDLVWLDWVGWSLLWFGVRACAVRDANITWFSPERKAESIS